MTVEDLLVEEIQDKGIEDGKSCYYVDPSIADDEIRKIMEGHDVEDEETFESLKEIYWDNYNSVR